MASVLAHPDVSVMGHCFHEGLECGEVGSGQLPDVVGGGGVLLVLHRSHLEGSNALFQVLEVELLVEQILKEKISRY